MTNLQNDWELGIASSVMGKMSGKMSSAKPEESCFCWVLANVAGTRQTQPGWAFCAVLCGSYPCKESGFSGLLAFLGISGLTVNAPMDVWQGQNLSHSLFILVGALKRSVLHPAVPFHGMYRNTSLVVPDLQLNWAEMGCRQVWRWICEKAHWTCQPTCRKN